MERREVGVGEMAIGSGADELLSRALGSCVAVTLYDATRQLGGMVHCVLPACPRRAHPPAPVGRYVASALPRLRRELVHRGAGGLVAKIVGGASVIEFEDPRDHLEIGNRNAEVAVRWLSQNAIPLVAQDLGGNVGREACLRLKSGDVVVSRRGALDRVL